MGLVLNKLLLCRHRKKCENIKFPWANYLKGKENEEKLRNSLFDSFRKEDKDEFLRERENHEIPENAEIGLRKLINDCLQTRKENRIDAEQLCKALKEIENAF